MTKNTKIKTINLNLSDVRPVSPDNLFFDAQNPRLTGLNLDVADQNGILSVLWKDKEVSELVDSIAFNGYWQQEVLFAVEENNNLVVVEGNRRLAAVKLLRSQKLYRSLGIKDIPTNINKIISSTYDTLPVLVCKREDLWMYMGFKHLNGPLEWDSIAKAEYIAYVHEKFHIPLTDIASTIGDRHDTVKRMYHGLAVLRQAEKEGVFNKSNAWGKRFAYSHLWTGLGYASIQRFLGIKADAKERTDPVPKANIAKLGELCLWLYGDKTLGKKPIVKSQNPDLRKLSEILSTAKGYPALCRMKDGDDISIVWRFSRGDEVMLRESLVDAEKSLKEAHGYLPMGFGDKNTDLLQQGKTILKLAETICEHMQKQHDKGVKK